VCGGGHPYIQYEIRQKPKTMQSRTHHTHKYSQAYIRADRHTYTQRECIHTHTHTHKPGAQIQINTHAGIYANIQETHTYSAKYRLASIHPPIHTNKHTYIHTYRQTHTSIRNGQTRIYIWIYMHKPWQAYMTSMT